MMDEEKSWKPGDPIRVYICRLNDTEMDFYEDAARKMGHSPYEYKGWMCADLLGTDFTWRAKDAVFRRVKEGTYHFTKDENGTVYLEGP